jgi:hypothetical protein
LIAGTISKTDWEVLDRSVDFSLVAPSGTTMSIVSVTASDSQGLDVTSLIISGYPSVQGFVVNFRVVGGSEGKTYAVSVKVQTSDGQKFEGTVGLFILSS